MRSDTQKLTFGAMLVAVFGVLLLINRQTAGFFEEFIFFVLPIPIAIFALKYGWKDSLPVFVAMTALSFFLGTPYTIFYAASDSILGILLGTRLKSHANLNHTQLLIMVLSAIFSVVSSVLLASLFGVDINLEITQMRDMMMDTFRQAGLDPSLLGNMLTMSYLKRLFVISMVLMGLIQGFLVFRISLLVLKRLRLPVPAPTPIGMVDPPVWSGFLAMFLFVAYYVTSLRPLSSSILQNIVQTAGICGYFYLLIFGWIALVLLMRRIIPNSRILASFAALASLVLFARTVPFLGGAYVCTPLHDWLVYGKKQE